MLPAWHGGQEPALVPPRGQVSLPLAGSAGGFGQGIGGPQGAEGGLVMGTKLSLRAPSRRGNGATGCQCSLWERHTCRKK